jgi:hypothetical protein
LSANVKSLNLNQRSLRRHISGSKNMKAAMTTRTMTARANPKGTQKGSQQAPLSFEASKITLIGSFT